MGLHPRRIRDTPRSDRGKHPAVRAVYDKAKGRWELHLVCKDEIETPPAPGNETAGVDLGICNFAAVAYSTKEAELYPGNRLKQDGDYFPKEIAKCDDSGGERATRLHAKWSERRTHFFHSVATHIVERCVENGVERINVGTLAGVREDDHGETDLTHQERVAVLADAGG